jgi:hypothetical protein
MEGGLFETVSGERGFSGFLRFGLYVLGIRGCMKEKLEEKRPAPAHTAARRGWMGSWGSEICEG